MTLAALTLDDLTYEDLRALAMRNIPTASDGHWTHHEPVDAGVTLLELFAFLLEQQLFLLDQVPNSLVTALLQLLGEAPQPTQAARTVLVRGNDEQPDFVTLEEDEAVRPASAALTDLVFTSRESALLPRVAGLRVAIDGNDVTNSLAQGRPVPLMARLGSAGRLEVDIETTAAFGPHEIGQTLALALVLQRTGVDPEWAVKATEVPPPNAIALRWDAAGDGGRIRLLTDGTGGLRRSGLIRFAVPDGFSGHRAIRLTVSTAKVGHAQPPMLQAVHVGAAIAWHRRCRAIGPQDRQPGDRLWAALKAGIDGWLPISKQTLVLPGELSPAFEDSIALRLRDRDGAWHDWLPAADLAPLADHSRGFTFDRDLGLLRFGDGYNGRVPAPAQDIAVEVALGGGSAGNHPAGMEWRGVADDRAELNLLSAVDAVDGLEGETLNQARDRVAASLAERTRAITEADFIGIVGRVRGIGRHRAHVVVGHDPNFPCRYIADSVTVFVVPQTELDVPAPIADDGAIDAIRAKLEATRMITTRVFVERPRFRPIGLLIHVASGAGDPTASEAVLRPALAAYLHPTQGGPDRQGWPFGHPLRPSELFRVAQDALGAGLAVDRVAISLLDDGSDRESCADVAIGEHDLVYLKSLTVKAVATQTAGATL